MVEAVVEAAPAPACDHVAFETITKGNRTIAAASGATTPLVLLP